MRKQSLKQALKVKKYYNRFDYKKYASPAPPSDDLNLFDFIEYH